jgi:hypothetical protein
VPDVKKNKAGDDTRERIETGYPGLHPTNTATVDLLYTEAKSRYDANRERSKTLDGKAGTLITIITTGFGAFAILGDPAKIGTTTTWVIVGLFAFAAAFVLALVAQRPSDVQFPNLSVYVNLGVVTNPANAIRVKYELTRAWLRDAEQSNRSTLVKGRLLNAATAFIGIGLASLTLNYIFASPGEKPVPTVRVILQPSTLPAPHH